MSFNSLTNFEVLVVISGLKAGWLKLLPIVESSSRSLTKILSEETCNWLSLNKSSLLSTN